jgi:hypothetical protein
MADDDGVRRQRLKDPVDLRGKGGLGFEGETAVPQWSVFPGGQKRCQMLRIGGRRFALELRAYRRVDCRAARYRDSRTDAAVHEDDAVDLDHRVARAKPSAVLAIRPERQHQLDEADRCLLDEPRSKGVLRERLGGFLRSGHRAGEKRAIVAFAQLFGTVGPERRVLPGADVAQVPEHPHRLVITEQSVDAPARPRRLPFQTSQQVEGPARVGTPVDDITRLHEDRPPARPALAGVDEPRCP